MVYHITNNVIDVKVCSISFQRHCTSLLNQQKNQKNAPNGGRLHHHATAMADGQSKQQQLPVVEIRPFTKKVWRREKSLPDFYDKQNVDEPTAAPTAKGPSLEISPAASRLVREFTESRKSMETRQNSMDASLGKYRSHPKAEFSHESNKSWRKQDLIPGFITRYERTRTSMEILSRENSSLQQRLPVTNSGNSALWDNEDASCANFTGIRIRGGKMSQHIHRRHLLYLNPLDTYRQPTYLGGHFNSSDNSRNSTGRNHLAPSRNSFPLTSGRAKELILAGSHFNHPLKPIQREDAESPHRFNSKLGAAKCSLQILNKLGAPTKLEKALEKEYEMNLERFRKDRLFLPHDLKSLSGSFVHFDSNPTIGETFLRNAREANKPKRRGPYLDEKMMGLMPNDTGGWYTGDTPVPDIQRTTTNLVNHLLHPIDGVLHEELEHRLATESKDEGYSSKMATDSVDKSEPTKLTNGHSDDDSDVLVRNLSVPKVNLDSTEQSVNINAKEHPHSAKDLDLSCIDSLNIAGTFSSMQDNPIVSKNNHESVSDDNDANCSHGNVPQNVKNDQLQASTPSTNLNSPIDSSRLETNIDYLHNLQRKSKSNPSHHPTPTPTVRAGVVGSTSLDLADVDNQTDRSRLVKSQRTTPSDKSEAATLPKDGPNGVNAHLLSNNPLNPDAKHDVISAAASPEGHGTPGENLEAGKPEMTAHNTDGTCHSEPSASVKTVEHSDAANNNMSVASGIWEKHENAKKSAGGSNEAEGGVTQTVAKQQPSFVVGQNQTSKSNSVVRSAEKHSLKPNQTAEDKGSFHDAVEKRQIYETGDKGSFHDAVEKRQIYETESEEVTKMNLTDGAEGERMNNVGQKLSLVPDTMTSQNPQGDDVDQQRGLDLGPEDEGISITTPIEAAVLDSSMTEACSDQEGVRSGSADNGDSGISTTFITSDESKQIMEVGLRFH